jgi:hypothetical protein
LPESISSYSVQEAGCSIFMLTKQMLNLTIATYAPVENHNHSGRDQPYSMRPLVTF